MINISTSLRRVPWCVFPSSSQFLLPMRPRLVFGIHVVFVYGVFVGETSFHLTNEGIDLFPSVFVHRATTETRSCRIGTTVQSYAHSSLSHKDPPEGKQIVGHRNLIIHWSPFHCILRKKNILTPFSGLARLSNNLHSDMTPFNSQTGTSSLQLLSFLKSCIFSKYFIK